MEKAMNTLDGQQNERCDLMVYFYFEYRYWDTKVGKDVLEKFLQQSIGQMCFNGSRIIYTSGGKYDHYKKLLYDTKLKDIPNVVINGGKVNYRNVFPSCVFPQKRLSAYSKEGTQVSLDGCEFAFSMMPCSDFID